MKSETQAVVIGGGLIGCSILYHLTKLGWTDVVLLERDELTSGSTWHAAANIHGLHDNSNISRIQHYTMNLYKELERITGQGCGVFQPGALYLAQTPEREHQLRLQAAKAKYYNLAFHEIDRDQAEHLHPLVNFDGIRCIMWEPCGGNVDPSGVTNAYAQAARLAGAEIMRFTPVTATEPKADGGWLVRTPHGDIHTQVVINAAGLWAREVATLAGINLPLIPTEHQYLVTETMPEIAGLSQRLPTVSDRDGEYYMRQEGQGLLVGAYEKNLRFWAEDGTPEGFGHELFNDDLDRIEENLSRAIQRVPDLEKAGIRRVINGPMIWSPDSNALFGPVPELNNYFCCNGIIPGFSQSGGLGLLLAEWVVNGEPHLDMFPWDLARFGSWANKAFTRSRVADQYANRFAIHFPGEERSAGRPVRVRPAYEAQKGMGAVFGFSNGWEHPLWFADQPGATESKGFTRQNWWAPVGQECMMLRERAGIIDISNFAKYRARGPGASEWLNAVFANRMPEKQGGCRLTPLISLSGGIAGDFTVSRLDDDEFLIIGSGIAERYHQRFFAQVEKPKGLKFESLSEQLCGFNVAGPRSRDLLQKLTSTALANNSFPFMHSKRLQIADIDVIGLRVSFTGDLGWELHCQASDQLRLYEALLHAGAEVGAGPVGSRALGSLRIEKGYGSWSREYSIEYWPHEVGMATLCKTEKAFLNRDAAVRVMAKPPRKKLVMLALDSTDTNASNADASGGEPIFQGDTPIGHVTSGSYSFSLNQSLALGFVNQSDTEGETDAKPGGEVQVMVLGKPHRAHILAQPPFDPDGVRLRS